MHDTLQAPCTCARRTRPTDPLDPWLAKLMPLARRQAELQAAIHRTQTNLAQQKLGVKNLTMKLERQHMESDRITRQMQELTFD